MPEKRGYNWRSLIERTVVALVQHRRVAQTQATRGTCQLLRQ
jgi:hypothetical protein